MQALVRSDTYRQSRPDYIRRHGHVNHVQRQQKIQSELDSKAPMLIKLVEDKYIRRSPSDKDVVRINKFSNMNTWHHDRLAPADARAPIKVNGRVL